ncbi:MAG: TonB-dependent receptor [Rhizobacter sp.]
MPAQSMVSPTRLTLALSLAFPLPCALAQTVPEPASADTALETIVVTADRRAEPIKNVPMSVSTLGGEKLDVIMSSGQDVRALAARVPSLNIESSFGRAFPRFYLRGYGNTDFRLNASQPVSLVYDDVVQENPILKGFPIFDLDQVEVLRGPQGTLFGRNSPAGVVKFDSVKPRREVEGYGSVSYGTYNAINVEGAVNTPIGESWAARLSFLSSHRSPWVENTYDAGPTQDLEGHDDNALRAQLLYQPHKDFSALFNLHARDLDGTARVFRANIIQPGTNDLVSGFDPRKVAQDGQNESSLLTRGGSLRLRWGLDDYAVHSITGVESLRTYNRGDIDGGVAGTPGIPFSSETADGIPTLRQITQEVRVETLFDAPLNWQAGAYYFHEKYDFESFSYDSTAGGIENAHSKSTQKNDAWALFGSATYVVTPEVSVRGGLRYTHDEKDFATLEYYSNNFGTPPTYADLAARGPLSASPRSDKVSFDLSGTWKLTPATNVYARLANGFRGASVQGAGEFNDQSVAKPETNTSVEAGVKSDLFDKRGRIAFNVFYYQVKDQQLTAVGGGQNSTTLINADKTVGTGAELDFQAFLTDRFLVSVGASYNKTEIQDPTLSVGTCAACTVTNARDGAGRALIDGNPLPQAPRWTTSLTAKYTVPTPTGEWYVYTDWSYRTKVNFFLYESVEFTGKPLTEGGLRLGYTWGNGQYDVALFGRNITNERVVTGGIDFNNLTGFINEPRTFGAQFRAMF